MKTFNAIQIVIILMAMPTLLSLLRAATFVGAGPLFWVAMLGTIGLSLLTAYLVRAGMD